MNDLLMSNGDVFIVVPTYNEGDVLSDTIADISRYGFNIVVVDDGSTVPAVRCLRKQKLQRVWCLTHACNLGQGAALQTGTDYALLRNARIIVHFDADGQHDPALIHRIIQPIRDGVADVTLGSRFLDPHDRAQVPTMKRIVLKMGIVVSGLFTGLWLTDTHNGFRALSCAAAEHLKMTENGFAHATEILELLKRSRLRYVEVPATIRYTTYTLSKGQSVFNSINIFFELMIRKLLR